MPARIASVVMAGNGTAWPASGCPKDFGGWHLLLAGPARTYMSKEQIAPIAFTLLAPHLGLSVVLAVVLYLLLCPRDEQ